MGKFFGVTTESSERASFRVAAIYTLAGAAWILFSDRVLLMFVHYPEQLTNIQTLKGWFFVFASGGMIHFLVWRYMTALRRQDETLREVAQGISVSTGEAFFESLVQHLAKALDADYAMVCESVPGGRLKSLACYSEHTLAATCDVSIGGSPMERVMNEVGVFAYRAGVAKEFPDCHFLEEWGIQSFIGIALIGSAGTRLGVIALMYRYPQRDISLEQEILPVFAVRAAVELERRMSEKELRENEALLRVIFDGAFQLMGLLTPEGTLIKINRTAYEFIEGKEETVLGKPFWETPWWNHSPAQQLTLRQAIAAAANGEFIRFAATHIRPDGGVIHVDFSLTPVKDEEGRVILLVPEGRIINRGD